MSWLSQVRELQSLAQSGLSYAQSPYDLDRYARLRDLAADMLAALGGGDPEQVRVVYAERVGYETPKLDVRAAVFDAAGRVLLVREVQDGLWTLPGGWADVGESLAEGAVREVREESGYVVAHERLLGFYERERWGHPPMPFFTLKAVIGCRLLGGAPAHSTETDGVGWYGEDDLPPLSTGRCSRRLLARVFEHHRHPGLPPDLD